MVPTDHTGQSLAAVPLSNETTNWTIGVSEIKTLEVSNVSLVVSEEDIKEFFSFSGEIQYVEMRSESDTTQLVYVTFKDSQGADTALLLSGATIAGLPVTITHAQDYQLPPDAVSLKMFCYEAACFLTFLDLEHEPPETDSAVKKAEDVVSTMLAKGFVLGKDAINKAKAFDEQHKLTSNASATVTSIDQKMGLSEKLSVGTAIVNEKLKEMDDHFQVSEKTKSAYAVAEQKASSAGSAIMSNRYVLTGATWVTSAFSRVTKAAEDVSMKTKVKVEKAEEEKKEGINTKKAEIINDLALANSVKSPEGDPPLAPIDSTDSKLGNI
ncbi:RRM domain-containing protein [Citrus sinensis]|uniref:RRM domain-containing protein n=1 Tax=Citrus sinensis TaxID=2711 RepID=A0ACB8N9N7_CITSI|nr:RRM domain-containing protein [Citrus sinensis]